MQITDWNSPNDEESVSELKARFESCYMIAMALVPRLCPGMHTGRLCLHFVGEMTCFSGQSPEGMGSQAEHGNQDTESSRARGFALLARMLTSVLILLSSYSLY